MQLAQLQVEREAQRLLPQILAELFDETAEHLQWHPRTPTGESDQAAVAHGRTWLFQVKSSSSPGLVADAAERFDHLGSMKGVKVLVVPFMTRAGEAAAARRHLNWIDLSGNAHIRDDSLYISVSGRPNRFAGRGRPSSAFAPKSARVARIMLLDPEQWWRQKDLAEITQLDTGQISRVIKRLRNDRLIEGRDGEVRPRDPEALLDAWADEYRFDRHEIVRGHLSGSGIELSRTLEQGLTESSVQHAFTGLPAAWMLNRFARFRLNSVYVKGDPYEAAEQIGLRQSEKGSNVQLIAPDDEGVFSGVRDIEGLPCVSAVQVYLDLRHLPERGPEAAASLRQEGLWNGT